MTQVDFRGDKADESDARIGPAKIRALYDKGIKATAAEAQRFWENLSYISGEQWTYWNTQTNRLEEMPRDPARVRVTINRLAATLRRLYAKSLKKPLVFEVPPTAADDETITGARIAESILADLRREQNWEAKREEVTIAAMTGGTAVICLDWDPGAGTPLETAEDGRAVGTGEVKLTCLSIVEAVTEPGTRDIETAAWWIKAQALPASEVKEAYGLKENPPSDASTAMSPVMQKIIRSDRASKPQDLTLVLTYYERPSKDNTQGQVAVVVGEKIVDGPHPWPFPFTERLNAVAVRETRSLHRWTGETIVSHAVPIQTAYNAVWSAFIEHVKLCGNSRILWPEFAGDEYESLSDLPSEIVKYMPQQGGQKPEWWAPSPVSQAFLDQIPMLERTMDDTLGTPDVVRGEAPRNIESGSGLAILSEQAETPVARLATNVADGFARIASLVLELYEENVTETRQARVDFPHQVSQTVPWSGKDICGQTRAIVPENAVLPVSEAEVWTKGVNLYDRGGFGEAGSDEAIYRFSKFVESSGEANFVEATDPDVAKCQRENYMMALGEPMLPASFDDHAKHIRGHNDYRKSAAYERLAPELQAIFDQHIQAHETLAAEDAAAAANRQMNDQGGGFAQIPTANQDPGSMMPTPPPMGNGQQPVGA